LSTTELEIDASPVKASRRRKEHCINGHLLAENSYILSSGARQCLICRRERDAARKANGQEVFALRMQLRAYQELIAEAVRAVGIPAAAE
jgi:hypothetical protein